MLKKVLVRAAVYLLLIFAVRLVLIEGLDILNVSSSEFIHTEDNQVYLNEEITSLNVIENLAIQADRLQFTVDVESAQYTLCIRSLDFDYSLSVNGETYYQNTDDDMNTYNPDHAYIYIDIEEFSDIIIEGDSLEALEFFIAPKEKMDEADQFRTVFYSFKLMCITLLTLVFILVYLNKRSESYFIILIVIGLTSIVKSIGLGELTVFSRLFGFDASNVKFYDNLTTFINSLLPVIIMLNIFGLRVPKRFYKWITIVFLTGLVLFTIDFSRYYFIVFVIASSISIGVVVYGAACRKEFYQLIVLNAILYYSLAIYKFGVDSGIFRTGNLNYYTNTAYIGVIIYMSVFAFVLLKRYRMRMLKSEEIQKEFERIELLRGISHDLRLPLSVIKISSQMIESKKLDEKTVAEYASDISEEISVLEKMTDNINAYLKLGHNEEIKGQASVKTVCERIEKDFNKINSKKCFDFKVICNLETVQVSIQEIDLYRILYNLVDNAFKYSEYGGTITLKCRAEGRVFFVVEDTGIGIGREMIENILSPFYRIDHSKNAEGMGLGLSVVKGIVDKYGGELNIQSEVGKGTLIEVALVP
jgi:signal transduction histidine kinase